MRRWIVLAVCFLALSFIFARQRWSSAMDSVGPHVAFDVKIVLAEPTPGAVTAALDSISDEIDSLRTLASTCPILFRCSFAESAAAKRYLDLEAQRISLFREIVAIAEDFQSSREQDVLLFEFTHRQIEYRHLLPKINAAMQDAPVEFARALEALRRD